MWYDVVTCNRGAVRYRWLELPKAGEHQEEKASAAPSSPRSESGSRQWSPTVRADWLSGRADRCYCSHVCRLILPMISTTASKYHEAGLLRELGPDRGAVTPAHSDLHESSTQIDTRCRLSLSQSVIEREWSRALSQISETLSDDAALIKLVPRPRLAQLTNSASLISPS